MLALIAEHVAAYESDVDGSPPRAATCEESMGVEVGQIVGEKYRLLRQIGEGGMGSVWSAVHLKLDRTVAIKFLHVGDGKAERADAEHFAREAKSAAKVSHRYVVDVFDFGVTGEGVHYMVQEQLVGEELARAMDEGPAWQARDVVRFMAQCLTALEAVHASGLVHRDIKPENIFIARDAEGPFPKLLDFGICHVRAQDAHEPRRENRKARGKSKSKKREAPKEPATAKVTTEGTPAYMAPEQLRGMSDLDGRTDLYSVAVTLYEWLSGRLPYEQVTPEELCRSISARSAVPLSTLRPELGPELSAVVMQALSPAPHERFESAADMRDALLATLPSVGEGMSVVQKSLVAAPIGSKTERILSAASCPFVEVSVRSSDDDTPKLPLLGWWRSRAAHLAAAAAGVALLGFSVLPRHHAPAPREGTIGQLHASARVAKREHARNAWPAPHGPQGAHGMAAPPPPAPARRATQAAQSTRPAEPPARPKSRPVQPAQASLRPGSKHEVPAQPRQRAELGASHHAGTSSNARIQRVEGGFPITVQEAHPSEPAVEERPLTAMDIRRLGL
jgi:serine/threonine-protein kinase